MPQLAYAIFGTAVYIIGVIGNVVALIFVISFIVELVKHLWTTRLSKYWQKLVEVVNAQVSRVFARRAAPNR
jgi:hypothetical protein